MSAVGEPKQHHYVPRFYLERFADLQGRVWAFDKVRQNVFCASPAKLAREGSFYSIPALGTNVDQAAIENMLSELEGTASRMIAGWLRGVIERPAGAVVIEANDRDVMAHYIAVQAFRTAELRVLLGQGLTELPLAGDLQSVHVSMLSSSLIDDAAAAILDFIWVLGHNDSGSPFYTSDHPVVLRSSSHRCLHFFQFPRPGSELLFPLSPDVMLYGYERTHWASLEKFDNCISPVRFTRELAESDNQPQVGHSRRFVFCDRDAFGFARSLCAKQATVSDQGRERFVPTLPRLD